MAEPLKYIYNDKFFSEYTEILEKVLKDFQKEKFLSDIFGNKWETLELKARMRRISTVLKKHLSEDFKTATHQIFKIIEILKTDENSQSFEYMFLPDYIELYGLNDYETSVLALEEITQFTSCEFAVRPFIVKFPDKMMKQMLLWSKHDNLDVRRFSTEGCRPRLPWAMALPDFKKDPTVILPILENLKNDSSDYVRNSVANNLNDISKDHPELVIGIVKKWKGKTKDTDKLVKHASRTLLKAGNQEIMEIFGFGSIENLKVTNFQTTTPRVKVGTFLDFSFDLHNTAKTPSKVRLEYAIYYQKANGTLTKKVYKISEKDYKENSISHITKRQSFKLISTRKFHPGLHQVAIVLNGKEFPKIDFELIP